MLFLSFCLWCSALAFPSQNAPNMDGVTVYPIVYEDREDDQQKVIVFGNQHSIELKRASVLAPRVLLRNYKDDGTTDQYVSGAHYERHLYENAPYKASLLVKPRKGGRYHIAGFINSTHSIEPVNDRMDLESGIPHRISRIPSSTRSACREMIKARSRTNASVTFPEARKGTAKHVIEIFLMSDSTHTEGLRRRKLDPMEYFMTFMYKKLKTETEEDERRAGGTEAATKQQKKRTNKERATTERAEEARGVKPRRQRKRCAARDDELLPAFLRRALDQGVPARSTFGGLSKVQGRGLLSGSCLGAVAGNRFVDEAYLVRSSWVVA
ncbi:hypothetical protein MTO96_031945 [Rhipicephalus appendiculatus]